jgi:hypothetical protein
MRLRGVFCGTCLASFLAACGGGGAGAVDAGVADAFVPLNSCIDDRVTIAQGVYGQMVIGCDTPDCSPAYAVGAEVHVYDSDPTPPEGPQDQAPYDSGTHLVPVARETATADGFYQADLAPGAYYLCANGFCVAITLPPSPPLARWDFTAAPWNGWHEGACVRP